MLEKDKRERESARERLLEAAYDLFLRHGVRAVGIDAIVERAGVARMTLYHHFKSKEGLALAVLQRREERWTKQWLLREVEQRAHEPRERLLVIFDLFDEWFQRADYEGCPFIRVLLETRGTEDALHAASADYIARIRAAIAELAAQAQIANPERFAQQWQILMRGSIVAAAEGDRSSAREAKRVGALLLQNAQFQSIVSDTREDEGRCHTSS